MQLGLMEDEHYRSHHTVSETSVADLVENIVFPQANKGVEQAILLLSGDGGIVDTVNSLLSKPRSSSYRNPTVSLLPLGTGNALANSSGLTGDNTLGLRAMLQGGAKELPLFRVTFSSEAKLLVDEGRREQLLRAMIDGKPVAHGAVVCSWGHHASLVADSDTTEYRKFGAERFKMAAKEALFPSDGSPPHAYRGTVSIRRPGEDWKNIPRQEHGYVLATFVSQLEAGFTISPASKPLDGKLRLVHFGDLGGQEAMDVMTKAFQGGKHVDDNRVGYEEIEGVLIEFEDEDPRWRRVCIDGIIVVGEGGWVEVSTGIEGVVDLVCRQT
jgi:diacylglycerol kinase family enzyme